MPKKSYLYTRNATQSNWAMRREIRNSTAEFLIFQIEGKEQGIEVFYKDESIWCTQKAMATLFDCSTDNVGLHLKNIFSSGELVKDSVTEKISATASDGKSIILDSSLTFSGQSSVFLNLFRIFAHKITITII